MLFNQSFLKQMAMYVSKATLKKTATAEISESEQRVKNPKTKQIRKRANQNRHNSKSPESDATAQESPESFPLEILTLSTSASLKSVYTNIRDLIKKARFAMDTYLACLKILRKMSFEGCERLCKVVAAAIVSMAGKVHQYHVPGYKELVRWGGGLFKEKNIETTQAEVLRGINFEIPLINTVESEAELIQQIAELETCFD